MSRRRIWFAVAALLIIYLSSPAGPAARAAQVAPASAASSGLPSRLSDDAFWKLETDISEPGGYFRITDNYTSNEREVGRLFTMLRERGVSGGVYLGVGPEQNFSYIASIRPAMAFIVDIRRQAVMQHLMFKAIFELSRDRADFISMLFAKTKPAALDKAAPIQDIWNAFARVPTDASVATADEARIVDQLTRVQKFSFTADESAQLKSVIEAFVGFGPDISTRGSGGGFGGGFGGGRGSGGTFAELTGWALDDVGEPQSFLSTDEHFQTVKALEDKNLVVPVSGDFGGPKAVRAIGAYLHDHGGTVSAFYVSNVEQYLFQDGKNADFYENVATLPVNEASVFIRPYSLRGFGQTQPLCGIGAFIRAARAGRVQTNNDALACVN